MSVVPGALFDTGAHPAPVPLPGALRRITYSENAWVDHLPAWMGRADLLFERLRDTVRWGDRPVLRRPTGLRLASVLICPR